MLERPPFTWEKPFFPVWYNSKRGYKRSIFRGAGVMRVGVLGANFKSAPIDIRERLSRACQEKLSSLSAIARQYGCVILATCNRIEIYFNGPDLSVAHSDILGVLKENMCSCFEHKMYSYFGVDCFSHLAEVTAGIDSAIVAESEIQRQVKSAYLKAAADYPLTGTMHYLFQKSLQLGKYVRSHFRLAENQVSIPKLLYEIGHCLFEQLCDIPLLFVGNSEINRKVIAYFQARGVKHMWLCSRSVKEESPVALLPWTELSAWNNYPFVICGSHSPSYLIQHTTCRPSTQLIVDLSLPRIVDPKVSSQVKLLCMEELIGLIETRQQRNEHEIDRAKQLLLVRVQRHISTFLYKQHRTCPS